MKFLLARIAVILLLLPAVLLAQGDSVLGKIVERGELRVGTTGKQPPLTVRSKEGDLMGYEIELATMLAEAMNLKVQFVEMPFADLLPALASGSVDVVMSGMTMTPERNLKVAFVGPYIVSGKSILAKAQRLAEIDETAEIDRAPIRVAALKGSTSESFVERVMPHATLTATEDYDAGVIMLISDNVDLIVADFPICALTILRNPTAGLATLDTPLTIEPIGMAIPANAVLFQNLVTNYLGALQMAGVLQGLEQKWFKDAGWLIRLP